jgi:hypothetical protein
VQEVVGETDELKRGLIESCTQISLIKESFGQLEVLDTSSKIEYDPGLRNLIVGFKLVRDPIRTR